ncbi:protoporphyrinogen/coproporphyrinogen oxidase [Homoserinibacter sp. YIM 151385]|uniref:protoporphyrinogen/coproporphyrinogen oxidase n=1 Tax=Homoserinibacter sp. YIM 151385 TaxID=2985506 RepID=UPI0022F114D9|nr:FAD-dependent oxidoreductase [Homoserinibacter sp. YIM 151385]WBU37183.1 FAD-dependent oxidoreductase [Homoserinibacter sp. YIM 151385]
MARERVLVVGGGVAGLVAARRLAAAGIPVTLLEASDRLGGQLAHQTVAGVEVDAAAESFATRGGQVAALATELGLGGEIVTPLDAPAWLHRADGSSLPLPATSLLGIPAVPLAADVIQAVGVRAALRAQLDVLQPGPRGAKSQTLGELVRTRMGAGVLEQLVAPVVRGVHSVHPDELEVDRAAPGLRTALLREGSLGHAVRSLRDRAPAGSQVAGLRGGVHRLVIELVADLERFGAELRTGARVRAAEPGRVVLEGGEVIEGEVFVAAPGLARPARAARRIHLATLAVEAPELRDDPRGTGVLVAPDARDVAARALTHSTAKWAWLRERAGGLEIVRLSYDEKPASLAQVRADASALLGVPVPEPVEAVVVEWTRGAPSPEGVDGMRLLGEAGATTGLAAIVREAGEQAERFLSGGVDPEGGAPSVGTPSPTQSGS